MSKGYMLQDSNYDILEKANWWLKDQGLPKVGG